MNKGTQTFIGILTLVLIVLVGWTLFTMPDDRSFGEHVGDTVDAISEGEGLDDAAREMENRTPAERMGDAIEDATDGDPE